MWGNCLMTLPYVSILHFELYNLHFALSLGEIVKCG